MTNQLFVRRFDINTKAFTGGSYEDPDYTLKDNETLVAIPDGLCPPYKWNGSAWVGSTQEEFEQVFPLPQSMQRANEDAQNQQNVQETMNANLMRQVASLAVSNTNALKQVETLQAQNEAQAKVNAGLMKDSATLKVQLAKLTEQPMSQQEKGGE